MPSRLRRLLGFTAVLASGLALVPLSAARTDQPTRGATAMPTLHRVTLLTGDVVQVTAAPRRQPLGRPRAGPDGTCRRPRSPTRRPPLRRPASRRPAAGRPPARPRPVRRRGADRQRLRRRARVDAPGDRRLRRRRAAPRRDSDAARLPARTRRSRSRRSARAAFAADKRDAAPSGARSPPRRRRRRPDRARRRGHPRRSRRPGARDARHIGRADPRARGLGRRLRRHRRRPSPSSTPATTRPTPTSPAGRRARRTSPTDPSVVDGNGHGTHVASTIAGTGAAADGLHGGVAPGATLIVGKVLDDGGYRRGLLGPGRHAVGRRPGRRRRQHEPRRRRRRRHRPAQPRGQRALGDSPTPVRDRRRQRRQRARRRSPRPARRTRR